MQQKPKPEHKEAPAPSRDRGDTGGRRPARGTEREQEEVLEDPRPKIPTALRGARGRCRDGRALAAQGFLRSRSLSGGARPVLTLLLHLSIRLSVLIKSDTRGSAAGTRGWSPKEEGAPPRGRVCEEPKGHPLAAGGHLL